MLPQRTAPEGAQQSLIARYENVIWAAGFFDGEGCISIVRQARYGRVYFYMSVCVYQNVKPPLDDLAELFAGSVTPDDDGHRWRTGGAKAAAALKEMLPFLRVKQEQAITAIEFQGRRFKPGSNRPEGFSIAEDERDYLRCRQLKRGWST